MSFMARLRAGLAGERAAFPLEALRFAGRPAYDELLAAEQVRDRLESVWSAPPAVGSQLLAAGNAFVLQTLGEAFLDAAYEAGPGTAGHVPRVTHVPPVTFDQAAAWLTGVEVWVSMARQAQVNPEYDLSAQLVLPAALPPWAEVPRCPPAHLAALQSAIPPVREHIEVALHVLVRGGVPARHESAVHRLRQSAAEAAAAVDYAAGLRTQRHDPVLHELIETNLRRALELWFRIGQLAAMPSLLTSLLTGPEQAHHQQAGDGPGFDPWCMTDQATRRRLQQDPLARQAVADMWRFDPNPAATLAIQAELDAGLRAGELWYHVPASGDTCYFEAPFAPIYEVRRPLRVAGVALRAQQQFTIRGGARRGVVLGPFRATTRTRHPR